MTDKLQIQPIPPTFDWWPPHVRNAEELGAERLSGRFTEIKRTTQIVQPELPSISEEAMAMSVAAMESLMRERFDALWPKTSPVEQATLTVGHLHDLMQKVFAPAYRVSEHVPLDAMLQINPEPMFYGHLPEKMIIVGKRAARAIDWEVEGKQRWTGRNWRRIKRERRKFVVEGWR